MRNIEVDEQPESLDSVTFWETVEAVVRKRAAHDAKTVEKRILAGANEVMFIHKETNQATFYKVPSWWRHPKRRWQIAKARKEYRRETAA